MHEIEAVVGGNFHESFCAWTRFDKETIDIHCLNIRYLNIHCLNQVVYNTLTQWQTVFHWVSKRMHVMWYTSSDWYST